MRPILPFAAAFCLLGSGCLLSRVGYDDQEGGDPIDCVPETAAQLCARHGATCGELVTTDRCGGGRLASCGTCTSPDYCGGGGIPNACGRTAWFPLGGSDFGISDTVVTWGSASGGGLSNKKYDSGVPVTILDVRGHPLVIWDDYDFPETYEREIFLRRWNGMAWTGLGGSDGPRGLSDDSGNSYEPSAAIDGDSPTVVWRNSSSGDDEVFLRRWDGTQWEELAGSATTPGLGAGSGEARTPVVALDAGGDPIVAWVGNAAGVNDVYVRRYDGTAWTDYAGSGAAGGLSSSASASMQPAIAADASGDPIVAWREGDGTAGEIFLLAWDGDGWAELAGSASGGGLSAAAGRSDDPSIAIDGGTGLVVAWSDDGSGERHVEVRQWTGIAWEDLPGASEGLPGASKPSVGYDAAGDPVVAFYSTEGESLDVFVRRWDGAQWRPLANAARNVSDNAGDSVSPSLAAGPAGEPAVAWLDDTSGNDEVYVRQWSGEAWSELNVGNARGGGLSDSEGVSCRAAIALDDADRPVVAWEDHTYESGEIYLKRWSGDGWEELDDSARSAGVSMGQTPRLPSLALDDAGNPALAWLELSGDQLFVRRWSGTNWVNLQGPAADGGLTTGVAANPSIQAFGGHPVVAWQNDDGSGDEIYVLRWDGSAWTELGGSASGAGISGSGGLATDPALAIDPLSGDPVVAWRDQSRGSPEIYLKRWHLGAWEELGGSATGGGVSNLGGSEQPRLVIDMLGIPTVAWRECFGWEEIYLKRWDDSAGAWEELGTSAQAGGVSDGGDVDTPSLVLDSHDNPVVSWEAGTPGNYEIFLRRWDGMTWVGMAGSDVEGGISNSGAGSYDAKLGVGPSLLCVSWMEAGTRATQILMRCSEL